MDHLRREASPLLRYRSGDLARVWTSPCACGRSSPRIRIDARRDDMLRVQAVNVYPQAIGALLAGEPGLGRHCVVAEGDPVRPPLELYVEAPAGIDSHGLAERLRPRSARASTSLGSSPARCPWPSTRPVPSTGPHAATYCRPRWRACAQQPA